MILYFLIATNTAERLNEAAEMFVITRGVSNDLFEKFTSSQIEEIDINKICDEQCIHPKQVNPAFRTQLNVKKQQEQQSNIHEQNPSSQPYRHQHFNHPDQSSQPYRYQHFNHPDQSSQPYRHQDFNDQNQSSYRNEYQTYYTEDEEYARQLHDQEQIRYNTCGFVVEQITDEPPDSMVQIEDEGEENMSATELQTKFIHEHYSKEYNEYLRRNQVTHRRD